MENEPEKHLPEHRLLWSKKEEEQGEGEDPRRIASQFRRVLFSQKNSLVLDEIENVILQTQNITKFLTSKWTLKISYCGPNLILYSIFPSLVSE